MSSDKQIVLITGGNGGIGYCLASLLIADASKHVIITSRSVEKGEAALKELQALKQPGIVEMLQLDVTNPDSIKKLAEEVEEKYRRLDALVNNAAQATVPDGTSLSDHMQQCFLTNVTGPTIMGETFLPLLKKSSNPSLPARILNVGSGAGSVGLTLDPKAQSAPLNYPYKASKGALNMVSAIQLRKFQEQGLDIKVFTYCPGFTVSNLSKMNNKETGAQPTVDGTRPMVAILNGEKDSENGGYLNHRGGQHPW